jgi:hypothetical protein
MRGVALLAWGVSGIRLVDSAVTTPVAERRNMYSPGRKWGIVSVLAAEKMRVIALARDRAGLSSTANEFTGGNDRGSYEKLEIVSIVIRFPLWDTCRFCAVGIGQRRDQAVGRSGTS